MSVSTVRSLDGTKSTRDSKEESSLFPVQGRRTASPHSKGEGGEGAQPITALLFLRTIKYFSHGPNLSMLMNFFAEWGEDVKLSSFSINICLRWLRYQHKAIEWVSYLRVPWELCWFAYPMVMLIWVSFCVIWLK